MRRCDGEQVRGTIRQLLRNELAPANNPLYGRLKGRGAAAFDLFKPEIVSEAV